MTDSEIYKQELIQHLNTKECIKDVSTLWSYTKDYYLRKKIPQGGVYASWQDWISVSMKIDEEMIQYKVDLNELKKNNQQKRVEHG